eukprot:418079_1
MAENMNRVEAPRPTINGALTWYLMTCIPPSLTLANMTPRSELNSAGWARVTPSIVLYNTGLVKGDGVYFMCRSMELALPSRTWNSWPWLPSA